MNLSEEEARRFSTYCYHEAQQHDAMARNMSENLSGVMGGAMADRERNLAVAFGLVGARVDPENWERITVKGKGEGGE